MENQRVKELYSRPAYTTYEVENFKFETVIKLDGVRYSVNFIIDCEAQLGYDWYTGADLGEVYEVSRLVAQSATDLDTLKKVTSSEILERLEAVTDDDDLEDFLLELEQYVENEDW